MIPVKIYTQTIAASSAIRLMVEGKYFKILSASGLVRVDADFGQLDGLNTGVGLENTPFTYLNITNKTAGANTVSVLIGDQNFIDALTGNVGITSNKNPVSAAFANVNATVTNTSGQLLAANSARQYLLIQNKDSSASVYVNFGGTATVANGVRIGPGGSYELASAVSTQQINAIGDTASNANVVTVEG